MLDQVIYNLLNNAAIHTSECEISIMAACYADMLQIIIEDNGQGFANVDPAEVFSKFSRERNTSSAGSGLGLSIVKGFTEALNGTVEAKHLKEGGAQFTINIPVKIINLNTIGNE
jgi:Osmosensitive K+ channel histidine kinase